MVMNTAPMEIFPRNYYYANFNRPPEPQHHVRAADYLPINASSDVIEETELHRNDIPVDQYVTIIHHEGRLICRDIPLHVSVWLKLVTIANNIYHCNVILEQSEQGMLLKTKKEIVPGEPLIMWFDTSLLLKMNIPLYLEPKSIVQSDCTLNYKCPRCGHLFPEPNSLKLHIALDCKKFDKNFLWDKLAKEYAPFHLNDFRYNFSPTFHYQMLSLQHQSQMMQHDLELKSPRVRPSQKHQTLPPPTVNYPQVEIPSTSTGLTEASTNSSNLSNHSSVERQKLSGEPVRPHSAFRPYSKQRLPETNPHNFQELIPPNKIIYPHNYPPQINPFFQVNYRAPVPIPNVDPELHAAQMETIVSNLGKSKDGHHCLYCNRVYSRKYGLKIHIRTHTGYKPLKCKICSRPFGDPSNLNKHIRLHATPSRNLEPI